MTQCELNQNKAQNSTNIGRNKNMERKFCSYCGTRLVEGAHFCKNCGAAVARDTQESHKTKHSQPTTESPFERKIIYEGYVHKCPSCGEVLDAFVSVCPSCGHELRGVKTAASIKDFSAKIEQTNSDEQKVALIRTFPISNTKEDIFEFMILASSNIVGQNNEAVFNAWRAKFEQCYQKAKLIFIDDSDYERIQKMYKETIKKINKVRFIQNSKKVGISFTKLSPVLPQLAVSTGWIISLLIFIPLCDVDSNYQVFMFFDFILGGLVLPPILKSTTSLPKLVAFLGLAVTIIIMIPLCVKNDDYQVMLFFDFIASGVIFVGSLEKK